MKKVEISGVYCIVNFINGHFYVGSSKNISNRWSRHKSDLRKEKHGNRYLQRAWNKYGVENFGFNIIEETSVENLVEREQYYLDSCKPQYNMCPNAFTIRGIKRTQEVKDKIGRGMAKFRKAIYEYTTKGTLVRTWESVTQIGRETKMSHLAVIQCCKREKITVGRSIWRYELLSPEEVLEEYDTLCSLKHIKYKETCTKRSGKRIGQYTLEGEFIKTWDSIREAHRHTGADRAVIKRCCSGQARTAGGFIWKYTV
jgi:group I intron endonuclease